MQRSTLSSVTMRRVPLAPMGCPMATAPPNTFTLRGHGRTGQQGSQEERATNPGAAPRIRHRPTTKARFYAKPPRPCKDSQVTVLLTPLPFLIVLRRPRSTRQPAMGVHLAGSSPSSCLLARSTTEKASFTSQ